MNNTKLYSKYIDKLYDYLLTTYIMLVIYLFTALRLYILTTSEPILLIKLLPIIAIVLALFIIGYNHSIRLYVNNIQESIETCCVFVDEKLSKLKLLNNILCISYLVFSIICLVLDI